jgi:ribonuclease P protein component
MVDIDEKHAPYNKNYSFRKNERLCSKKIIRKIFNEGDTLYLHPFKLYFLKEISLIPTKVMFSVPKRNFKKAVDRNNIRRKLKEAYRTNKNILPNQNGFLTSLAIVYIAKENIPFVILQEKLIMVLYRLNTIR